VSKLIRTPIDIKGIQVQRNDNFLLLSASQGKSSFTIPTGIDLHIEGEFIKVTGEDSCLCGTVKRNLQNLVLGLRKKFTVTLKLAGVGYKVNIDKNEIVLNIGYSHEVRIAVPEDITVNIPKSTNPTLEISSIDKVSVTTFAGKVCKIKKYNPYKQYGILWEGKYYPTKQARAKR
jgi:large subunit ribosomal protein L6